MSRYRVCSRDVNRLGSISKSPIYQQFAETMGGLETIRAYKMEHFFIAENCRRINSNSRTDLVRFALNRWLSLRLECIGASIVFCVAVLSVLQRDTISAGNAGFSLAYALALMGILNGMVRWATDFEQKMNAVERIGHYIDVPSEAPAVIESNRPPKEWPTKGTIVIKNLEARYRPGLEPVLRGVSFRVEGGQKVGVVGRTGAGKSSLMLTIFRLLEPSSGTIEIDGIDISKIGLDDLRSKLSIVPQDPVLFSGTIRSNLDILNIYSDYELWSALDQVQLKQTVEALPGQLDFAIVEGGENLSVGQRQLMCLARALLQKNRIIILDEATSAVDLKNDQAIQNTIRSAFAQCTMLIIAHRINTVMDCDKILGMSEGRVVEYDSPANLMKSPTSLFCSLVNTYNTTNNGTKLQNLEE